MRYIPKKIHLIWFGRNPYSSIVQRCIKSWEKYCPDYELIIWNEDNFDINSNVFVQEAYEAKKWAFVSDYVRLYALYTQGGVYIDSDCELLRSFEKLLDNQHVVTGYSSSNWIPTGFLAAEKGNCWIKELLDYYTDRHFKKRDGSYDMKVNNVIISELSAKYNGFKPGDKYIKYGNVTLFPREYFHPYKKEVFDLESSDLSDLNKYFKIGTETVCIHYGTATWVDDNNTYLFRFKHLLRKTLPQPVIEFMERIYYRFHKWGNV